jgi:hypothetical protein
LSLPLAAIVASALWALSAIDRPGPNATELRIEVKPGSSLRAALKTAADAGALRHPRLLEIYSRVQRPSRRVTAGRYALPSGITPRALLRQVIEKPLTPPSMRRAGLPRRLSVHVAGERPDRPLPTGLATWDWDTGRADTFNFDETQIVEEAIFVPRGPDESDAWLIAPSINLAEGVTELHAFDAGRVSDGPVATWRADLAQECRRRLSLLLARNDLELAAAPGDRAPQPLSVVVADAA